MNDKPLNNIADAASENRDALPDGGETAAGQAEVSQTQPVANQGQSEAASDERAPVQEDNAAQTQEPLRRKMPVVIDRQAIDREFVEKACDPAEYLISQCGEMAVGGGKLHVYAASRIGLGHIRKNTPCQDACMYREIPYGAVLLDADGISACDYGQVGAKLACEAAADAVESASRAAASEEEFVKVLCTRTFYEAMREDWLNRVNADWAGIPHQADDSALFHYGTTLLFAVVTENWYVTFNIGDGQILLFNEDECMRIRLAEKEGQAPNSLIYGTYLEDVQRGVWDRKQYKGILLTTDGVYDRISRLPWYAGHHYALQAAERFEKSGGPKAPFIYSGEIEGEQRTIDLSRQRSASDDCSIVMALNMDYGWSVGQEMVRQIREHIRDVSAVQLLRRIGDRASYLVFAPDGYRVIFAAPWCSLPVRDPRLKHFAHGNVRLWQREESWKTEGIQYGVYRLPKGADCNFLEGSFQCMQFHSTDQYHKVPDEYDRLTGKPLRIVEPMIAGKVLSAYRTLTALEEHLACQNMCLNEMAAAWIAQVQDEKGEMLIPIEALCETGQAENRAPWAMTVRDLFPGLIGYLTCRDVDMPLFALGAGPRMSTYYFFGAPKNGEATHRFFQLRYNAARGQYGMYNASRYPWEFTNSLGRKIEVAPGKTVGLTDGCRLTVTAADGKTFDCVCRMI